MKNLTQHEIPRLSETFNLTDGHVHRGWDESEKAIIDRLNTIFQEVNREQQPKLEREHIEAFFKLGGQTVDYTKTKYLLSNSASANLEIIANYLRLNNMSIALIEPCFDNLADIFRRHKLEMTPLPEKCLVDDTVDAFLEKSDVDAFCIVSPNNPTGLFYTKENLTKFAEYCKRNNKLLILDASFGLYNSNDQMFDEYALLNEIGVDYICVEDTGKTWPTHDIKISIMACTPNLYQSLYEIYTDFILHVSPFTLKLLTEFFKNSDKEKLHHIRNIIKENRKALYDAVRGTFLEPRESQCASVAWLEITNNMTALELKDLLDKENIFVLPGNQFFWSDRKRGDAFIRVALTRDISKFSLAMQRLHQVLKEVEKKS